MQIFARTVLRAFRVALHAANKVLASKYVLVGRICSIFSSSVELSARLQRCVVVRIVMQHLLFRIGQYHS
jgi:hypothetical protein